MKRYPYDIRIGLDYGTSFSKCVYRNLNTGNAYVASHKIDGRETCLFSSAIIYENGFFHVNRHNNQYPENGLFHIKMAVAQLGGQSSEKRALNTLAASARLPNDQMVQNRFIRAACLFYLSRLIQQLMEIIKTRLGDFGDYRQDAMFVNMAIPVSGLADKNISNVFLDILKRAVKMAKIGGLKEFSSLKSMEAALDEPIAQDAETHVYPEISASIHAFRESTNAAINSTNIYLASDIGAGTVDQCTFTCTSRNGRGKNNYFSAHVFPLGSSLIDMEIARDKEVSLERIVELKESGRSGQLPANVLQRISDLLSHSTLSTTLVDLKNHLYNSNGVNPYQSIRDNLYLIFSGGGYLEHPYFTGVQSALWQHHKLNAGIAWEDRINTMSTPPDLNLDDPSWMPRLYVAYGLADEFDNLAQSMFPDQTAISPLPITSSAPPGMDRCLCGGRNSNCPKCGGLGYY